MPDKKKKPVREFRVGCVKASIWARKKKSNSGADYTEYSVSIVKSYKDDNGDWRDTTSYFPNDLFLLELVTRKAAEWIHFDKDRI